MLDLRPFAGDYREKKSGTYNPHTVGRLAILQESVPDNYRKSPASNPLIL